MCYNKLSDSYTLHQSQFFVPENEMDKSINGNWYLTKKGGFCLLHFSGSMSIDFTFVTCKISFFSGSLSQNPKSWWQRWSERLIKTPSSLPAVLSGGKREEKVGVINNVFTAH